MCVCVCVCVCVCGHKLSMSNSVIHFMFFKFCCAVLKAIVCISLYVYGTVSCKITLLGSFLSLQFYLFSVDCKEPVSKDDYASTIELSIKALIL